MPRFARTRYTNPTLEPVDVFILGAGFSKAIDEAMPLTNELTSRVKKELADAVDPAVIDDIPFIDRDFEKALSYLAERQPWQSESERLRNRALFLDLSDAVHRTLVSAQDDVLRKGLYPNWLISLVYRMHASRAVVITLNYDTLLEMALCEICTPDGTINSRHVRPFAFPAQQGGFGISELRTIQLLKLHGSLHWTYSGTEEFFGQTIEDKDLPKWSVAAGNKLPYDLPDGRVPLLIPPTLSKTRQFENEKLRWIWHRASLALAHARRVFCVGYSLPPGDLLMRFLLHDSRPEKEGSVPFWLVSPDGAIEQHYRDALPSWYQITNAYVRDRDYEIVRTFADDFSAGDIEAEGAQPTWNRHENLAAFLHSFLQLHTDQTDFIDGSQFSVVKVLQTGLILKHPRRPGSVFVSWDLFARVVKACDDGKFDQSARMREWQIQLLAKAVGYGFDREVLSVLINTGALVVTEKEDRMTFRSLPHLSPHSTDRRMR